MRGRRAATLAVEPLIRYIDAASTLIVELYLHEQRERLADVDRVQRDVLELLLAADPSAIAIAREAGIALDAECDYYVVAATARSGGREAVSAVAGELAVSFGESLVLLVTRHGTISGLVRADLTEASRLGYEAVRRRPGLARADPRVGIGLPTAELSQLRRAADQAERALMLTSRERPVVALSEMHAIDYLVAGADDVAQLLVPSQIRRLAACTNTADRAMLQTLAAYIASGLNVQQAAARLPAHQNTVHRRLARLEKQTGYDIHDFESLLKLVTEVRLVSAAALPPAAMVARPGSTLLVS